MREQSQKVRLARMLAEDKEDMNVETKESAVRDFKRIANEYFETDGVPRLSMERDKNGTKVTFTFHAVRVKNFTVLK